MKSPLPNRSHFKPGNKGNGGKRGKLKMPPKSFRDLLRESADWETVIKVIIAQACGRPNRKKKGEMTIPDYNWMKLLITYAWGAPTIYQDIQISNTDTISKLAQIVNADMKERSVSEVSESGNIVESESQIN